MSLLVQREIAQHEEPAIFAAQRTVSWFLSTTLANSLAVFMLTSQLLAQGPGSNVVASEEPGNASQPRSSFALTEAPGQWNTTEMDLHPSIEHVLTAGKRRPSDAPETQSSQRELIYEGMVSYGNYRLFGAAENAKLYTAGVEYDRELWPKFIRARVDYVSEFLPVVLLSQSSKTDSWGDTIGRGRKTVPGIGMTPIGFRLLWRDGRQWMPYFETKGSVLGFTQKALSTDATYENWSFHLTGGLKVKLRGRYDLRLGMLSDLHFSNAFVVRSNPALDVMNVDVGIVHHFGASNPSR